MVALAGYTVVPSPTSSASASEVACVGVSSPRNAAPAPAVSVSTVAVSINEPTVPVVPAGPVAGYSHEQLVNAAYVMSAAQALGLSVRAQQIGVMTAMGESGLRVLDYGDTVGPDSRGLFQQRDNGSWGTFEDRMDPFISATSFFTKLSTVQGWETLDPTLSAHTVQVNADPYHYTKYWADATTIVAALTQPTSQPSVLFELKELGAS